MFDFSKIPPEDFTAALQEAGSLVKFHATSWQGTVADFKALESVRTSAQATGDIGSFRKKLLANHDKELKALQSAISKARSFYYRSTAQWSTDPGSPRLLANTEAVPFMTEMATYQRSVEDAKQEFIDAYPAAMRAAMADLGDLASPEAYPEPQDIADKFRMSFSFEPIPAIGAFRNMPKAVLDRLSVNQHQRTAQRIRLAFKSGLSDLKGALENMSDRLGDPEAVFRNTLVSNVVDPAKTLQPFNIAGDKEVADLLRGCVEGIGSFSPDMLRKNANARGKCKEAADFLLTYVNKILAELDEV